jgi:hypothetical protein
MNTSYVMVLDDAICESRYNIQAEDNKIVDPHQAGFTQHRYGCAWRCALPTFTGPSRPDRLPPLRALNAVRHLLLDGLEARLAPRALLARPALLVPRHRVLACERVSACVAGHIPPKVQAGVPAQVAARVGAARPLAGLFRVGRGGNVLGVRKLEVRDEEVCVDDGSAVGPLANHRAVVRYSREVSGVAKLKATGEGDASVKEVSNDDVDAGEPKQS